MHDQKAKREKDKTEESATWERRNTDTSEKPGKSNTSLKAVGTLGLLGCKEDHFTSFV